MRYSKQRDEILRAVTSTKSHPTADWIYEVVQEQLPNISLGTVYRNLNQLVRTGYIKSIQDGKIVRYDGNTENHDHFKCTVCGKWYDMEILGREFMDTINSHSDFTILDYKLELSGICKNCK